MASETPFNSMGSAGLRRVSDPLPAEAFDGASAMVERTIVSSPGATPIGWPGTGLGVGVGLGLGLAAGAAVTGILLAPVKNDSAAEEVAVTIGLRL